MGGEGRGRVRNGGGGGARSYGLEAVPEMARVEEEAAEQHCGALERVATIRGARVLAD
jgi:hypothetical protein